MNTENSKDEALAAEVPAKQVVTTIKHDSEEEKPVDYRRVQHGHGPCSCCGPYSE
ncbi:hypothetical protein D3C72_88130 [compost metagenome]